MGAFFCVCVKVSGPRGRVIIYEEDNVTMFFHSFPNFYPSFYSLQQRQEFVTQALYMSQEEHIVYISTKHLLKNKRGYCLVCDRGSENSEFSMLFAWFV